jgi:hypothetical protein
MTLAQIVESDPKAPVFIKIFLGDTINDLASGFNIGNNLDVSDQIPRAVDLIYSEVLGLRVQDIRICFERGRKGKYGQLFNRFDEGVLCLWIAAFKKEREEEIERINYEASHNYKVETKQIPEILQNLNPDLIEKFSKPIEIEEKAIIEPPEQDEFSKAVFDEFHKIWMDQQTPGKKDQGIRTIEVDGRIFTQEKYFELKAKNK